MKLVYCNFCQDVFKLALEVRSCACGRCRGRYDEDGHHAVTNGRGVALAIGNGSLWRAVSGNPHFRVDGFEDKDVFLAWVRPHSGERNPRSRVEADL